MTMRRTGDQYMVKEINTSIVLDTIIRNQAISRASISTITGLNKGTVSSLVEQLINNHLVYETGIGNSSGGRKPIMLQFKKDCGYAIGVDLGVNYILTVLTDLQGEIINGHHETIEIQTPQEIETTLAHTERPPLSLPRAQKRAKKWRPTATGANT